MKRFVLTLLAAIAAGPLALATGVLQAQNEAPQYVVAPIDDRFLNNSTDPREAAKQRLTLQQYDSGAKKVLSGEVSLSNPTAREAFDAWIRSYKLAEMTQIDKLGELANLRKDFVMTYLGRAKDQAAKDHLLQLTFDACSKIVNGQFHPAVRYNAMLLIGELNQQELQSGFKSEPPVPYAPARRFLVAELKEENQSGVLKVAILVGLLQHAEAERASQQDQIPAAEEQEITGLLLDIVNAESPPADLGEDGQAWLRGRAVDVLAALGAVGENAQVFNALIAVLDDASAPLSLRCAAARGIGRLKYAPGQVDAVAAAQKVAALASQGALNQLARVEEQKKLEEDLKNRAPGGSYGGYETGGYDMMSAEMGSMDSGYTDMMSGAYPLGAGGATATSKLSPEDQKRATIVRRLGKYVAWSARAGLTGTTDKPRRRRPGEARDPSEFAGLLAAAKNDKATIDEIDKLVNAITAIDTELNIPDGDKIEEAADWDTFVKGVRAKAESLAQLLPQPAAPDLPEAPTLPAAPSTEPGPASTPSPTVSVPPTAREAGAAPQGPPSAPNGPQ